MLEHFLHEVEVGDHAVFHGPYRLDFARRASEHALGLEPERSDVLGAFVKCDNRRLVDKKSSAAHVDERVRGPEIDPEIVGEKGKQSHTVSLYGRNMVRT